MTEIMINQVKSQIGCNKKQRDTLKALGLGKIGTTVVKENSKVTLGMISKVSHLVKIQNL